MKKLIRSKIFTSGFFLSYFSFFVVTIFILDLKKDGVGVEHYEHGFPFAYYYSHCFGGYYLWVGLVGNMLLAAAISAVVGLAISQLWSKFSSPEFRSKWYL